MKNKNHNDIRPFIAALRISIMFLTIAIIGIYLTNVFILDPYRENLEVFLHIYKYGPYVFSLFASLIMMFLVYNNLNQVKKYEDTIKSNLQEIRHKEIDLYQAEYRINNLKYLIDNIMKSASLLILSLDENFNIKKIEGELSLFVPFREEDIIGDRIDLLFESSINMEDILDKNLKDLELKLVSNSNEDKYVLMDIDLQNSKLKNKIEYTAVLIDITQRKLLEDQVHYLDYYDPLTDLPNRVLFEIKYKNLKDKIDFSKSSLAFLYIDIDDFKHINESLNHYAGDAFLVYISKLLKTCISERDILSRITQDEFGIILPNIDSKESIEKVIKKIYDKIKIPWTFNEIEYSPSVTIGVSIAPFDGENFDILFKNAHLSSEHLKSHDKGSYQYYSKNLEKDVLNSLRIINELKRAIGRDEFILHYQTVVDLKTCKIIGVEALVRWIHPQKGMIPPMDFIPILEKTSLTYELMNIVVRKSLDQKRKWNLKGICIPKISINISSKSFSQKNFSLFIEDSIREYGLDNNEIVLELTESGFTDNIRDIESNINYLRNIGVEIAMDDFGTGYSTLSRLKEIPIDYLKLDKSFIDKMTKDSEEEVMVKSVIALAKTFGLVVLAEGIETKEQFQLLQDMNCDFGQGYYMSRPVPSEELNIK